MIKTFGSHLNYLREAGIYEKLKDTGLTAEVLYSGSDSIEHRFAEGISLYDKMLADYQDNRLLEEDIRSLFRWYIAFREKTGSSLEHLDLHKFILTEQSMLYLDFEHCKASFQEGDLAAAAVQLYTMNEPFSPRGYEVLCAFVRISQESFSLSASRLQSAFESALVQYCKDHGIPMNEEAAAKAVSIMA